MALSTGELERLADDIYKDRRINGFVYCGGCGYNLRTLPYVYNCPECGQSYNARPRSMKGIFAPQEIEFPFLDIVAVLVCASGTFAIGYGLSKPLEVVRFLMTLTFGVLTFVFLWNLYVRFIRFFRGSIIARRIAIDEEGDDEE